MDDIVERLHELADPMSGLARGFDDAQAWLNEAAAEIERLRAHVETCPILAKDDPDEEPLVWDPTCGRCGRVMPYIEAAITQGSEPTIYLCHPDDPNLPDCYTLWSWESG